MSEELKNTENFNALVLCKFNHLFKVKVTMNSSNKIIDVDALEELLSRPTQKVIKIVSQLDGDFLVLGIGGKIGPSLARMIKRACAQASIQKRIVGVDRFDLPKDKEGLENEGFEIIQGDLLDSGFISSLPQIKNVLFLVGMKFGAEDNLALTWAVNSYVPAMVVEHFKSSKIVAFSTGCVYELVPIKSGGSLETDTPAPVGEYAQSCLGRERMFEYGSIKNNTPVALIRLNYAVEMRYGVLVDIALKVKNNHPIDLTMGYVNVIWQGDANAMVIRAFELCDSPAKILNITGPETLSVRQIAKRYGEFLNKNVHFIGEEAETALLSNAGLSHKLFGKPEITPEQMIIWIADWITAGKNLLNKPTHFQVRDGKY